MPYRKLSIGLLFLSVAVYIAALFQKISICLDGNCGDWPGYLILLVGWLGVADGLSNLAWIANPLIFVAWIAIWFGHSRYGLMWALPAFAFAVSFSYARAAIAKSDHRPLTGSWIGTWGLETGYWLWLAAIAIGCLAAVLAEPSHAEDRGTI